MTEDEAKAKWCPLARSTSWVKVDEWTVATANREDDGGVLANCNCIGSGCMAWRWTGKETGFCGIAGSAGA